MITYPLSYIESLKASLSSTQDFSGSLDWLHIWHVALLRHHQTSYVYDICREIPIREARR